MTHDPAASDITFEGPVAFNEADLLDAGAIDSFAHNVLLVHELVGALDLDRLRAAYQWLGERHESFRSSFVYSPDGWRRRVHRESRFGLEIVDLIGESDPEADARSRITTLFRTPFDRASGPLLRVILYRLAPERVDAGARWRALHRCGAGPGASAPHPRVRDRGARRGGARSIQRARHRARQSHPGPRRAGRVPGCAPRGTPSAPDPRPLQPALSGPRRRFREGPGAASLRGWRGPSSA